MHLGREKDRAHLCIWCIFVLWCIPIYPSECFHSLSMPYIRYISDRFLMSQSLGSHEDFKGLYPANQLRSFPMQLTMVISWQDATASQRETLWEEAHCIGWGVPCVPKESQWILCVHLSKSTSLRFSLALFEDGATSSKPKTHEGQFHPFRGMTIAFAPCLWSPIQILVIRDQLGRLT